MVCFLYICSLKKSYGRVFSMKIGSYKFILASTPAAVYEMLVKKSADYAGRPQTYAFYTQTLGMYWWLLWPGPSQASNLSSEHLKKFQYGGQNACKGLWSEFLPFRPVEKNLAVWRLEEKNARQIHFLEITSFVLICKLPGLFLKPPCLRGSYTLRYKFFSRTWRFNIPVHL